MEVKLEEFWEIFFASDEGQDYRKIHKRQKTYVTVFRWLSITMLRRMLQKSQQSKEIHYINNRQYS